MVTQRNARLSFGRRRWISGCNKTELEVWDHREKEDSKNNQKELMQRKGKKKDPMKKENKDRKGMSCNAAYKKIIKQEQYIICVFDSKRDKNPLFASPFGDPFSEVIELVMNGGNA